MACDEFNDYHWYNEATNRSPHCGKADGETTISGKPFADHGLGGKRATEQHTDWQQRGIYQNNLPKLVSLGKQG